ncbi:MAG: hypothetical protein WAU07_02980 [Microgenomates group bacterium]
MTSFNDFNVSIFMATRKQMASAIALSVVGVGLLLFGVIPQARQAIELQAQLEKEKPKLMQLERKLSDLENVKFTPEFGQADIVDAALPSKKPLLELMMSLSSIAVETGVVIQDFEINPGEIASDSASLEAIKPTVRARGTSAAVGFMEFDLEILGTFEQVQSFLILVEKISPFTTINTLTLGTGDDTNTEGVPLIQTSLTTKTYYFTQPVKTTVEAPLPQLNNQDIIVLEELATFVGTDLPEQNEVLGGGLEDLFEVDQLNFDN